MEDMLVSECSSGCESGWTLYLEQSFLSQKRKTGKQSVTKEHEEEEEEDLSMVSDASSGPQLFHEEEYCSNVGNGYFYRAAIDDATLPKNRGKREKNRGEEQEEHPSFLDDTASSSSPIFNFSQNKYPISKKDGSMENVLEFSQGGSTTHLDTNYGFSQGRSAIHDDPFGFFQFPISTNQPQQNQWFGGGRWG